SGPGRPPMRGCRHDPLPGDPGTTALVALRAFGCSPCMLTLAFVHDAELRADRACDACGVERDLLTPITFTYAGTVICCHLCDACAGLFRYLEALPTTRRTTIVRVGRNDPCFCGAGKKYKRCHGRAA
ncbi:MAG: SEC-C metal-binding domain-containing protein, partial [Acidimicrobiales bacterium]